MLSEEKRQEAVEWMVDKLTKFPLGSQVSTSALYFGGEYTPGTPDPNEHPFPISTLGAIDMRDVEGAEDDDLVKIESALIAAAKTHGLYLDKSKYSGIVTGAIYNLAFTSYGINPSAIDYANIARFVFETRSNNENKQESNNGSDNEVWQKIEVDFGEKGCTVTGFGFIPQCNGTHPEGLPFAIDPSQKQSLLQAIKDADVLRWTSSNTDLPIDNVPSFKDAASCSNGFAWNMLVADMQHCHIAHGCSNDSPNGFDGLANALSIFGMPSTMKQ